MKLFHGSDHIVLQPSFGLGSIHNDYGQGFYCTESLDMALEWAVGHGGNGFANEYEFGVEDLDVIDLDSDSYCALHWLSVLLKNRTFEIRSPLAFEAKEYLSRSFAVDTTQADLICGYRADDSYFTFAQDFLVGSISYRQLKNAMLLGKLGRQVMVKSPRAFKRLCFIQAHEAQKEIWLPQREERDRAARRLYLDGERNKRQKGDLYITQILDEEIGPQDARLQ